jgi:hypothetical protein
MEAVRTKTPGMIENSHLIQIYSNTHTLWRGMKWSLFSLDIKINAGVWTRTSAARKENNTVILRALVENLNTREVHPPWESDKVRAQFMKYHLKDRSWNAHLIKSDLYNSLQVDVHRDLFVEGDTFRVLVAAQTLGSDDTIIFGASQPIR